MRDQGLGVGQMAVAQYDAQTADIAHPRVGHADRQRERELRMVVEQHFDLARHDHLPAAAIGFLKAAGQGEIAVRRYFAEIA